MAFRLGDIIVDRSQYVLAEDFDGNLQYVLTQVADLTIDVTAESKDATDAQGTLVKRFYQGKTGTLTANNAMLNLNINAAMSGSMPEFAAEDNALVIPKVLTVAAGANPKIENYVEGSVKVYGFDTSGGKGAEYTLSETAASATEFAIADGTLNLPVGSEDVSFIVKYDRTVTENAAVVRNRADKFPSTVKLTIKVLAVDPCAVDTLRAGYIVVPSFQPSPETSLSLTTDAQMEYKGDLQVDYCSLDKVLYEFYWADEDVEDEEVF